jgi:energy-coupling factor transporter ATP-binding protein EcfA2
LCPTNFLPDEPVEQDEFGSHERVADALYKTVMEGEGGKAIALVGSWGSGKSTFIKILEGKVKCRENLAVFVFDTWAHQGDPLRRSFLERLAEFLKERGWIGDETYNEVKEKLTQRKETVITETRPVLTGWGKVLVFFLILLPLGSALVNVEGRSFWKWVGFVILGIPSAIVFVSWIWFQLRKSKDKKKVNLRT